MRALITADEMWTVARTSGWRVVPDLALIWLQIVAALTLYVLNPVWWTSAAAFVVAPIEPADVPKLRALPGEQCSTSPNGS